MRQERYLRIRDYAVIGDCHTAALVSHDGVIDWCCLPRFDSPAVFARLLDAEKGGWFHVQPLDSHRVKRRYLEGTNVLETTFEAPGGTLTLTDFMPTRGEHKDDSYRREEPPRQIVRLLSCLQGRVEVEVSFQPRFDYAQVLPTIAALPHRGVVATGPAERLILAADLPWTVEPSGAMARIALSTGERRALILSHGTDASAAIEPMAVAEAEQLLRRTIQYWRAWSAECTYEGPYREAVVRSALTLKLLSYAPTGAIVAAPTTSLPEEIGGERNWDYRYCWLRDATMTLYALFILGYQREAQAFLEWLRLACGSTHPATQIMYGIGGEAEAPERTLDHLEGYRGSRPVRIGNAAAKQLQLDVYGEVLDTAHLYRKFGGTMSEPLWAMLRQFAGYICDHWQEPDEGIWEVRSGRRHFTYSKLMCWVGLDRALKIARAAGLAGDLGQWEAVRTAIRRTLLERGYNATLGAFTQSLDDTRLDASVLMFPLVGFIAPDDPRMRSTLERIRERLMVDGLVYRYRDPIDGLRGGEGAFSICTFWFIDGLTLSGQLDEAHRLFERMLGYSNDLGLYSEEIDPGTGELLGNFPQAFTHIALINAALNLTKAQQRGHRRLQGDQAERAASVQQA